MLYFTFYVLIFYLTIVMEERLFTFDRLNAYRDNLAIERSLNGVQLLNFREFSGWYNVPEPRRLPKREGTMDYEAIREIELDESQEITLDEAINTLTYEVCKGEIGETYVENSFLSPYESKTYDILVAVAPGYEELNDEPMFIRQRSKVKMEKVLGFIIVQLGECKKHPFAYAVNLICTRSIYGNSLKGALLLGAYLFCIKQSTNVEQIGLLELANGYANIGGFFAYSKMGFDKNISLAEKGCFPDFDNLPMSIDLTEYSEELIIGFASGVKPRRLEDVKDNTGLFALGLPQKENQYQQALQIEIAEYCNLLYKFEIADAYPTMNDNLFDHAGHLLSKDEVDIFLALNIIERNPVDIIKQLKSKISQLIDVYKKLRKKPLLPITRRVQNNINNEVFTVNNLKVRSNTRQTRNQSIAPYGGRKKKSIKKKIGKKKTMKRKIGKRKSMKRKYIY